MSTTDTVKKSVPVALVLTGCAILASLMYDCGKKSSQSEIADLTTKLAESEKTVEIKDGLYATAIVQMNNLSTTLLNTSSADKKQLDELKKQLADTQAQLLSTQQVVLKWKQAYEAELAANQTQVGDRTRVDFAGDLGPIHASGHTLTNPAEADLKLEQTRPLVLTVSVAKNKDGKWQSYVTSSDPNMGVEVNLAGVDPGVTSPSWRQRIWVDVGADFLTGQRASLGLSYHFDSWSLGAGCSVWQGGSGCGVTAGFRLFK